MARKRTAAKAAAAPSSELGTGDFAANYNSKGRAIRTCRTRKAQPVKDEFDDEDEDHLAEDDYDDDLSDEIAVAPSRKKKKTAKRAPSLSPTRELLAGDLEDAALTSDDEATKSEGHGGGQQESGGHFTVHLTVNIPLGHQGPITLHLDPKAFMSASSDGTTQNALARMNVRSKPKSKSAGFLDLPAELRNYIYREVFVTERPLRFSSPSSFSRSSALLRTCKQVHVC